MPNPQEIGVLVDRALWLASTSAVVAAAVSTALVWWLGAGFRRREWKLALMAAGVIGLAAAYMTSGIVLQWLLSSQLPWRDGALSTIYLHPGLIHKVLPVVSIFATWLLLDRREKTASTGSPLDQTSAHSSTAQP